MNDLLEESVKNLGELKKKNEKNALEELYAERL